VEALRPRPPSRSAPKAAGGGFRGASSGDVRRSRHRRRPPRDAPSPSVRIERLVDPAALRAIATVNGTVYGDPDHAAWLLETIVQEKRADPDGIDIYAAYERDHPIGVGWMRHKAGEAFGSLWGGSTLPEWRGRGIYSALVAVRAARARERGCRWLTVDCSPMSLPILKRRGFQVLSVITPFVWSPGKLRPQP
jgi:GNAT superfamily N-acetyltransferase